MMNGSARRLPGVPGRRTSGMQGITLISLLVGLAVASVVALGALSLFQRMAHTTGEARQDAQRNAQRNQSLAAVELLLQSAGFGIDGAEWGMHAQLLSVQWDAARHKLVSANGERNAVIWSENTAGVQQCSVLWSPYDTGGMRLLGPVACTGVAGWGDWEWGTPRSVGSGSGEVLQAQYAPVRCMPFGIGSELEQQTPRAQVSFRTVGNQGQAVASSVCLVNVKPPAAPAS